MSGTHALPPKGVHRVWGLETHFLGLLGVALVYIALWNHPTLNVVQDTIVLVVFLGGILGVAPISLPNMSNKKFLYPIVAGLLSAFMDSFLVLLMIVALPLGGPLKDQLRFKAYCTLAALIGGLLVYFGEVFALPHYLKYDMRSITDGIPLIPPVFLFLGVLAFLTDRLKVTVAAKEAHPFEGAPQSRKKKIENIIEFVLAIILLLATHNALLCLGVLFVYASLSGQGEDLINVMKTETEVGVMLLLMMAWVLYEPLQPVFAQFTGYKLLLPSMVNAVFTGAMAVKGGDVWQEIVLISAGALFLPISSLVGVMVFKTGSEWLEYVKVSVPLMILWLILGLGWFKIFWPLFS